MQCMRDAEPRSGVAAAEDQHAGDRPYIRRSLLRSLSVGFDPRGAPRTFVNWWSRLSTPWRAAIVAVNFLLYGAPLNAVVIALLLAGVLHGLPRVAERRRRPRSRR